MSTTQTPADAPASAVTQMKENTMPTTNDPATVDRPLEAADAPETADAAPDAPQGTEAPDEAHEDDSKPGRDAARYRRQLREAEGQLDTLRGQLDTMRRAAVDTAIKAAGRQGTVDLLDAAGVPLDSLLSDDGTVDAAKVLAALDAAATRFGVSVRTPPPKTPSAGPADWQGKVGTAVGGDQPRTFADAFAPRR